jgi:activator of 2-hydroxyglutaryl-CoA dehydratase
MQGAIVSLVDRSVQLMKRVQLEPEVTLVGGILRFETMVRIVQEKLGMKVNVPEGDSVQYVAALGAALLAQHRLRKLSEGGALTEGEKELA